MKKLEEKIIKKIYVLETKKTGLSFIIKMILFSFFGLLAIFFVQILIEVLFETGPDNIFDILYEDWQVIIQEIPKPYIIITLISLFISLLVLLTFIINFGKIRYKVIALMRYWNNGRSFKKP